MGLPFILLGSIYPYAEISMQKIMVEVEDQVRGMHGSVADMMVIKDLSESSESRKDLDFFLSRL